MAELITEQELVNAYSYYQTIPNIEYWRYMPEEYYTYFEKNPMLEHSYRHLPFKDFKKKYIENKDFREFIDERKFQILIEEYITKNAIMTVKTPGDEYYGGRYTGTYTISITWNNRLIPFLVQTSNITCN